MTLATVMAMSHLALIVVLILGGPISVRRPWFVRVHVPAAIATAAVFVMGADCPLTVWEKSFLRRAGETPYEGGFIEHHLVEPITGGGMTPAVSAVILASWLVPTVIAYTMHVHRWRRPAGTTSVPRQRQG
jgi:Na+/glutamate symporter